MSQLTTAALTSTVTLLFACTAPSRPMPRRIVDDPMSLPDNTALAEVGGRLTIENHDDNSLKFVQSGFTYAITDRLELVNLTSMQYTLLDDAPAAEGEVRKPNSFSLALLGGITGVGFSSVKGTRIASAVSLHARKRVATNAYVFVLMSAFGEWDSGPGDEATLAPSGGLVLQVTQRSAMSSTVFATASLTCPNDDCQIYRRSLGLNLGWSYRPSSWWTVGFGVAPAIFSVRTLMTEPLARDRRVLTAPRLSLGISGSLHNSFYW